MKIIKNITKYLIQRAKVFNDNCAKAKKVEKPLANLATQLEISIRLGNPLRGRPFSLFTMLKIEGLLSGCSGQLIKKALYF